MNGTRLRCRVNGSIGPLLERLATAEVTRLLSREPSLEELFLARYGSAPATGRAREEVSSGVR